MINIYDSANQLEQDLRKTKEYADLKIAYEDVKKDPIAFKQFKEFQKTQIDFQNKQMQGTVQEQDIDSIKELGEQVEKVEVIMNLMNKEKILAQLIDEINQIMFKPVSELYED
ncbi:YlbF family regulator [Liquorilactobacillus cacaonum]|uniref:UPF0342 protein FC80_GL001254 n=1 Tax=Liquorilactobacillus cacaonum DSM 21116 TaxID=1423729 RepID=A0A0R2CF56_9LACO|nr:YlbF family regulator [Liquorilactobacillus cacaonum]KRM90351.1 hypothetical protein FC80_GL001254 [Liquorilactobacillus cacaonum DSM 21116]